MIYINNKTDHLMMACDWLEWSGYLVGDGVNSLPDIECPDTYRLEILEGNNVYKYRGILYDYQGRKVLTFLWCPRNRLLHYNLITFQVANIWLYTTDDIQDVIKLASDCFIYQFATITRLDICVDFELTRKRRGYIKGLFAHKIYCRNKREGSIFWSKTDDELFPHDFNFGSFKSAIKWKLYNKTLELRVGEEEPDKPYIIDAWQNNNMNIYKIWRLEVSIKDFNKLYVKDMPLGKTDKGVKYSGKPININDVGNLLYYQLYADMYYNRFDLRKRGHTRACNDEPVRFFALDYSKYLVSINKDSTSSVDNSNMYNLIKVIESDNCKRNEYLMDAACDALFYCCKFNNSEGLFERVKGKSLNDYINEMRDSVGDGIVRCL